ncbi:MAG: PIN domain-containing protein [Leptolyngbyaceae cyanobacterium SU_3_3]|nr:PIN domain-containing protein [Leptolyngbyaceae cyanobacterium SU_3_3]
MTCIADTGFIVALANKRDEEHAPVKAVYAQQRKILVPQTVLTEVSYLLNRDVGSAQLIKFLESLPVSRFQLIGLIAQDIVRTAAILSQYQDSRIDFVDASVMAVAERYNLDTILTLDRRDFSLYRPQNCTAFTLLP